ncbi:hypothetical protein ACQPZJ_01780 [Actinoplanes sp. CA-054009]
MSLVATYDPILSRVRIVADVPAGNTVKVDVERSVTGVRWTAVRGGRQLAAAAGTVVRLDDYEFPVGQLVYYRLRRYGVTGAQIGTDPSGTVTVTQPAVWLKSITRPFLNRPVTVASVGDITRPAKNGVFDVLGRSYPVAVTDVRSSRRWDMRIKTATLAEADLLDLVLASGDPLYIQVPGSGPLSTVPGGYVVAGDVKRSGPAHLGRRWLDLPLTEVAPPGPEVVGGTVTWAALAAAFGSWSAVTAAFATWAEVPEYVADPETVIVP